MKHPFTYIISYRHRPDRLMHLRRVLDWINGFNGVDVIVVEQDKHSKVENLKLKCRHIFIKNDGLFNKSWSYNVAAKYAKSDIIIFGDCDLVMNPNDLVTALNMMKDYDVISPYNVVLDLQQDESNLSIESLLKITRPGRGEFDHQKINLTGGIAIFKREAFFRIGGWCEFFVGWGGEDDFQTHKVHKLLKWTELKSKCFHFYHTRDQLSNDKYQQTLNLLNQLVNLTDDDLQRHIGSTFPSLGLKNKYS